MSENVALTTSISVGRIAILHDVRKEISNNVDPNLVPNNEIYIDALKEYNYDLVKYTDAYYQPYINEFNEGKKRSRQITTTYTQHVANENKKLIAKKKENKELGINRSVRNPIKLAHEYVIQFGNRDTNSTLRMPGETEWQYRNRIQQNKNALRNVVDEIQKKYPHAKILLAVIHCDEPNGTPHMHILIQFEGEKYERGLPKRISLSKALELDGLARSGNRGDYAINRWTADVADNIMPPIMRDILQSDREVIGDHRKHEDIVFFRAKAKRESEALDQKRKETNHAVTKAKEELIEVENKLESTKEEIEDQKASLEKISAQNKDAGLMHGILQTNIKNYEKRLDDLGKEESNAKQTINNLNIKKGSLDREIETTTASIKTKRTELNEIQSIIKETKNNAEDELKSLDSLKIKKAFLDAKIKGLEADITTLVTKKTENEEIITSQADQIESAKNEATEIINNAVTEADQIRKSAKTAAAELTEPLKAKEKELKVAEEALASEKKEIGRIRRVLAKLLDRLTPVIEDTKMQAQHAFAKKVHYRSLDHSRLPYEATPFGLISRMLRFRTPQRNEVYPVFDDEHYVDPDIVVYEDDDQKWQSTPADYVPESKDWLPTPIDDAIRMIEQSEYVRDYPTQNYEHNRSHEEAR